MGVSGRDVEEALFSPLLLAAAGASRVERYMSEEKRIELVMIVNLVGSAKHWLSVRSKNDLSSWRSDPSKGRHTVPVLPVGIQWSGLLEGVIRGGKKTVEGKVEERRKQTEE